MVYNEAVHSSLFLLENYSLIIIIIIIIIIHTHTKRCTASKSKHESKYVR